MKSTIYKGNFILLMSIWIFASCESFVEVEIPNDKMVTETVFASEETAQSAMQGIYYELFNTGFSGGTTNSITVLGGLSADILEPISTNNTTLIQFQENEIFTENSGVLGIWNSAYNIIYLVNNLLEGIENSEGLSDSFKHRLEGEARFIRAFTYFYLVNLYENIPLVLSTDYDENSLISQAPESEIYEQIVLDLNRAREILTKDYLRDERFYANYYAATALMARVKLYQEQYSEAAILSSEVIDANDLYDLVNLDEVFLKNSQEAIWQISPAGRGNILTWTAEGSTFIGSSFSSIKLRPEFVGSFSQEDLRREKWIGSFLSETRDFDYVYKYKDRSSIDNITEYGMVLRLAEQYLIRAEARIGMGEFWAAIEDIDRIRERAGLNLISEANPDISPQELQNLIIEERRRELFAEWGHRWLDLKRLNIASEVLSSKSSGWEETDVLYPIPAHERSKNPNLEQNQGY